MSRTPRARTTTYTFRATGDDSFVFHPGDVVWARLELNKEGQEGPWAFTWIRGRWRMYEFERLSRGPRLHAKDDDPTKGEYLEDIRLMPAGSSTSIPRVPDLVPVVK